jgi:1-deoxy-D-xylulose-5-phosphate reductoisomerase
MKKKIAILGSTGSIGKTSLNIFKKNLKEFDIILLSANSNYSSINSQIKNINQNILLLTMLMFLIKLKIGTKKRK